MLPSGMAGLGRRRLDRRPPAGVGVELVVEQAAGECIGLGRRLFGCGVVVGAVVGVGVVVELVVGVRLALPRSRAGEHLGQRRAAAGSGGRRGLERW